MRRVLVFAASAQTIAGLRSPPFTAMPNNIADCESPKGAPGNADLCIQCYSCTYFNDGFGTEGGRNCLEGPFENVDALPYYRAYCMDSSGTVSNGKNNDWSDVECSDGETKYQSVCFASGRINANNNYYQYRLQRRAAELEFDHDLGVPSFEGYYPVRSVKTGKVFCKGDDCNDLAINNENVDLPAFVKNARSSASCKSCQWDNRNTISDDSCVNNLTEVESETCADNQVCVIEAQADRFNSDGLNPDLSDVVQSVVRKCVNDTMVSNLVETELDQERWTVCDGDLCNILGVDVDPDDLSPLPIPGQWDKPLSDREALIFCGPGYEFCIPCFTCSQLGAEDAFQPCATFPSESERKWYRRRFYDLRTSQFVINQCSVDTRNIVSASNPEYAGSTAIVRGVVQVEESLSDEPAHDNVKINENFDMEYCRGELCNRKDFNASEGVLGNECYFCKAWLDDASSPCVTGELTAENSLIEQCPTGVCMTRTSQSQISRGCFFEEDIAARVRGVETASINATIFTCQTPECNDNYVNNELEILENKPEFFPSRLLEYNDTEIDELGVCNDQNGEFSNEICLQCITCEAFRDEFSDPSNQTYLDCIVGANETYQGFFPRFLDGFPVTCAIQVTKSKRSNGYRYYVSRGATAGIDPRWVGTEGDVRVESTRNSVVNCFDNNCNIYAFNDLPLPPVAGPRTIRSVTQCFSCEADTENGVPEAGSDEEKCFYGTNPNVAEVTGANSCQVRVDDVWRIDSGSLVPTKYILRQPSSNTFASEVIGTDTWVCYGDNCNSVDETDLPPYDETPSTDGVNWADPIPVDKEEIVCSSIECIECLSCEYFYDLDEKYPTEYPCSSRKYRKSYRNPLNTNLLIHNFCAQRTGLRENSERIRYIIHGAEQSDDATVSWVTKELVGETLLSAATDGKCPVCESRGECLLLPIASDGQSCNICREVRAGSDFESMLTEKRGCALDVEIEEALSGRLLTSYQEQWKVCTTGDRCNVIGDNPYNVEPRIPRLVKPIWFPVPDDIYPENPETDCFDSSGEPDNKDLCISCYKCSFYYDSQSEIEVGGDCSAANPGATSQTAFKNYCEGGSAGSNGLNGDFANLRCDEDQVKARITCGATATLNSENTFFIYLLERKFVSVIEGADLGPPSFGGEYQVQDYKEGQVFCSGENCNDLDIQQPTDVPIRSMSDSCKQCAYSRSTNPSAAAYGEKQCFYDIDSVDSGKCGANEVCTIEVKRDNNNFYGNNEGGLYYTETLARGCMAKNLVSNRPETNLKQVRTNLCEGDLCNNREEPIDPEDVGPLPRPGRWDRPLTEIQTKLYCGGLNENCIQCYDCISDLGDVLGLCRNTAEFNPIRSFRRRFFDERAGEWVNNVCATQTAFVNYGVNLAGSLVSRGVKQVNDQELDDLQNIGEIFNNLYQQDIEFCVGDLCNGQANIAAGSNRCFFCDSKEAADTDACHSGVFDASSSTESCPTNVCMTAVNLETGVTRRGCALNEDLAKQVEDSLNDADEETDRFVVRVEGQNEGCIGSLCNTKYVDTDGVINDRPPFYEPEAAIPVFDEIACDDPNSFGIDTNLCIQCHNCNRIIDNNNDNEVDLDEACITDPGPMAYFFKSEAGKPVVCALTTNKILTDFGYQYNVRRGAIRNADPTWLQSDYPVLLQRYRNSEVECKDDGCNGISVYDLPVPPLVSPRRAARSVDARRRPQCFICNHEAGSDEGTNCIENPTDQRTCQEDEVCFIDLDENFEKDDDPFPTIDTSVTRGCRKPKSLGDDPTSIKMQNKEIWVCRGNLCNAQINEAQPPPYDPIPMDAYKWLQPLNSQDEKICDFTACKRCKYCEYSYGVDQSRPDNYDCRTRRFKSNFVDPKDTSRLLWNQCATRSGLRENGQEQLRFVSHFVTQSEDENMVEMPEREFVAVIKLTKAEGAARNGQCPVCAGPIDCQQPSRVCITYEGVCRENEESGIVASRGCASGAEAILFFSGTTEITEQVTEYSCTGEGCNDVNSNPEFRPDPILPDPTDAPTDAPTDPPTTDGTTTTGSGSSKTVFSMLLLCISSLLSRL